MWGVQIALTSQITAGTALVLDSQAVVVFQREAPSVFVDPYTLSTNNLVKFIVEERLDLGVMRPAAILAITFNGAT